MFPLYRDQSIDLQSKSTDWFPYDENIDFTWVNLSLVTLGICLLARLLVKKFTYLNDIFWIVITYITGTCIGAD